MKGDKLHIAINSVYTMCIQLMPSMQRVNDERKLTISITNKKVSWIGYVLKENSLRKVIKLGKIAGKKEENMQRAEKSGYWARLQKYQSCRAETNRMDYKN